MNTLLHFIDKLLYYPKAVENRLFLSSIKQKIPQLVKDMRKKDKIKVLFVVSQLAKWKTENLYQAMKMHPRFDPMIGVALGIVDYPTMEAEKLNQLLGYIKEKGYSYLILLPY